MLPSPPILHSPRRGPTAPCWRSSRETRDPPRDDLSAALDLEDTADLRTNRAITYESLERFADALADYEHALRDADVVDVDTIEAGRQRCLAVLAR